MSKKITVTFERKYDEAKPWNKNNTSPYISVASPSRDIAAQRNPNDIVINMKEIKVKYTYPLTHSEILTFNADNDTAFTRSELARKICEGYKFIYDTEHAAVSDPGHLPGMLNRKRSQGPYGIWGHDIGDLDLHTVEQVNDNYFTLWVDS